jgi:cysteinyl-tRNA synthetase
MTAHYRSPLNFTWEAMQNAQNSLKKIFDIVSNYEYDPRAEVSEKYVKKFLEKLNEDLNIPEALAVFWELVKVIFRNLPIKYNFKKDEFLGLKLQSYSVEILKTLKI